MSTLLTKKEEAFLKIEIVKQFTQNALSNYVCT